MGLVQCRSHNLALYSTSRFLDLMDKTVHAKVQATCVLLLQPTCNVSLFTIVNIRGYHRHIITLLILEFTVQNSVLLSSSRGYSRAGDRDEETALVWAVTAAYDGAKQPDRRSRGPDTNPIPP